ncbi:protein-L-isoaspartate(D-aspartate) O-methyltransferase [Streptomyces sp. RerS4]|uniref:protein-L-isoaspartate(D-aspartate) O-methyltransferase n=1 Tax=Streptomyces sp. RerS4 TaxID=2942449 RepID=UPI00201BBEDD|nr:protein-L-isoaspartate(D-aspartate) O-methyltransferase [Streptomyces sp. RerS4]UQX04204.1 protein-L-isoaspartate(D-aspartate) O-methyltransferase [Streptomyces sp. RerS4]
MVHDPRSPETLVRAARSAGVTDARLLEAVRTIPRADFVPDDEVDAAYWDSPLPLPCGQTTTQPSLVAMMVSALDLAGDERVLEIGTGYGWQTALLARLAGRVVSVERRPELVAQARRRLAAHGFGAVEVILGDGTLGAPHAAPYDGVIVCAAFPEVPEPLVEQLRIGGRLVQPVGPGGQELVELYERRPEGLEPVRTLVSARFVRLYGAHGYDEGRS